jgi:hypothetical protein
MGTCGMGSLEERRVRTLPQAFRLCDATARVFGPYI